MAYTGGPRLEEIEIVHVGALYPSNMHHTAAPAAKVVLTSSVPTLDSRIEAPVL